MAKTNSTRRREGAEKKPETNLFSLSVSLGELTDRATNIGEKIFVVRAFKELCILAQEFDKAALLRDYQKELEAAILDPSKTPRLRGEK